MADEGEVDVLGDFEFKLEADSAAMYDANELPSKSANLQPEFTDPPWLLDQSWPLDSSMDEKSKATIEKMLLEEQLYMNGRFSRKKRYVKPYEIKHKSTKLIGTGIDQKKSTWSAEEKEMFHKGMEIYGRSWTKIAELIPTRTSSQIKNFAHQYFRQLIRQKNSDFLPESNWHPSATKDRITVLMDSLNATMATVSTASPTVNICKSGTQLEKRIKTLPHTKNKKNGTVNSSSSSPVQIKKQIINESEINCEVIKFNRNQTTLKKTANFRNTKRRNRNADKNTVISEAESGSLENKLTSSSSIINNIHALCAGSDSISISTNSGHVSEDFDEDIEIDIEDVTDINPLCFGRAPPNSVYEILVNEANSKSLISGCEDASETLREHMYNLELSRVCTSENAVAEKIHADNVEDVDGSSVIETCTKTEAVSDDILTNSKDKGKLFVKQRISVENVQDDIENNNNVQNNNVGTETGSDTQNTVVGSETQNNNNDNETSNSFNHQQMSSKIIINAVTMSDGEVIHLPVPTSEIILQTDHITNDEKIIHKEFFENRPSKTPERYLRIRNYILDSWKKCKPSYLNKTCVRPGLKNCGDVNSIGRVHAYLESIGAINFECDQAAYKQPRLLLTQTGKEKVTKDPSLEVNVQKLEAMRPRKRKVKDAFGAWIDEKDLEGITIEHDKPAVDSQHKKPKCKQNKSSYDPFQLIPCLPFNGENPAPFLVEIHSSALIVMDIHSHISRAEVIGMLGGRFDKQLGKLIITMATPCNSISTGMQCEMDPVSQTRASEEIVGSGMEVVGWYHSHPSFEPNPSIRDIETQLKFQDWFSKGGRNFIGIILSPYNPRNTSLCSEVNCLTVSEEVLPRYQCNIPYKFDFTTLECSKYDISNIILNAQALATSYCNFKSKVDLNSKYSISKGFTCMEKMLESVCAKIESTSRKTELICSIRKVFLPTDSLCSVGDHGDYVCHTVVKNK